MKCEYCGKKSMLLVNEHFVPKSVGGKTITKGANKNIFKACHECNMKKAANPFWSFISLREYMAQKKTYRSWLKNKIKSAITNSHKRALLSLALDNIGEK